MGVLRRPSEAGTDEVSFAAAPGVVSTFAYTGFAAPLGQWI